MIRKQTYLNTKMRIRIEHEDLIWSVDAAFAVHDDKRSHTGAVLLMGRGAIQSFSMKQKVNTRSSTEAELVGVDDMMSQILWTRLFLQEQQYEFGKVVIHQDNKSTIKLEVNGRRSAGKRMRHLDIRYFFVTDQVKNGNVNVQYQPTDDITGDYMSKPLQGGKFTKHRGTIMNLP